MAPAGRHVLHAYRQPMSPGSCGRAWSARARVSAVAHGALPGVLGCVGAAHPRHSQRCDVVEGTPLTHRRFLNVHNGYGPALPANEGLFPGVTTPLKQFWMWLQHLPGHWYSAGGRQWCLGSPRHPGPSKPARAAGEPGFVVGLVLVLNANLIAGVVVWMGTDRNRQQQGSQGKRCAEKAEHGMGQHTFRPYRLTGP